MRPVLLGLGVLLTNVAVASGAVPTALTDPYAIFERARTYWDAASYPIGLSYGIVVSVTRRGVVSSAHYHAYYDTASDKVGLQAVSDEELAHPYTPKGVKTQVNLSLYGVPLKAIPLSAPERTFDYLGVPLLAPNYSFGLARTAPHLTSENSEELIKEIRAEYNDPAPRRKREQQSGLKTIANVEVGVRHYIITLAGITVIAGHSDYDLRLHPITNPSVYRLRELWINTETFATDQLVTQGNFTAGELGGVRWLVTFAQHDKTPYIESEQAQSGFELNRRVYDSATVAFTDIAAHPVPEYAKLSTFATLTGIVPEPLREP